VATKRPPRRDKKPGDDELPPGYLDKLRDDLQRISGDKLQRMSSSKLPPEHRDKFRRHAEMLMATYKNPYPTLDMRGGPLGPQAELAYKTQAEAAARLLEKYFPAAESHRRFRESQQRRARNPRVKVGDSSSESLSDRIKRLALAPQHADSSARELWPGLFGILDQLGCRPEERPDGSYTYFDAKDNGRVMTFRTFSNHVAQARAAKKKSR
jgi:hypothetical protein